VEKHLESKLPDYMVPRCYVTIDALPTLPTGKVNRKALPNPFSQTNAARKTTIEGETSVEQEVVNLFKELLQLNDIEPHTNFIQAGGDSLLTAILLHRVYQRFTAEIKIDRFVECATAAQLVGLIRNTMNNSKPRSNEGKAADFTVPTSPARRVKTAPAPHKPSQKQDLIIISAGKFGRETFAWAEQAIAAGAPWRIKGFLDNRADALKAYSYGVSILGDVENYKIEKNDVFIGAIGDPKDKLKYYTPIIERGGRFVNVIHPLANMGKNVQLGVGIVLAPFASVTCDVQIGDHVSIGAFSNAGHDTVIGNWSQISSHCGINGNASLGEGVFLGSHVCIIPSVKIGDWAFVGAGSIVTRPVPQGIKVFGSPAKQIGAAR
jgi:sugar O-acyltransferase (sialic acid O-acetyltransferase NeuD family)